MVVLGSGVGVGLSVAGDVAVGSAAGAATETGGVPGAGMAQLPASGLQRVKLLGLYSGRRALV